MSRIALVGDYSADVTAQRAIPRAFEFAPAATGDAGDVRAAELPRAVHPFFAGTLFQPERAALRGQLPPLVRAFVAATLSFRTASSPA